MYVALTRVRARSVNPFLPQHDVRIISMSSQARRSVFLTWPARADSNPRTAHSANEGVKNSSEQANFLHPSRFITQLKRSTSMDVSYDQPSTNVQTRPDSQSHKRLSPQVFFKDFSESASSSNIDPRHRATLPDTRQISCGIKRAMPF